MLASTMFTPTLRRKVDLPAILEPVMILIWAVPRVEKLLSTDLWASMSGWPRSVAVNSG